jgi:phage virion morphogenesis protein
MIDVKFNSDAVARALAALSAGVTDMSDPMAEIAEALLASTEDRIAQGISPDGSTFAPRSQVTLDSYERRKPPVSPKGGPLVLTGTMSGQIASASGPNYAEIGSNAVQAAMLHFGGTRSAFPNLWGDIPARPFIGLSDDDETAIAEIVEDWIGDLSSAGN